MTAIVLSMIEDDVLPGDLASAKPVCAMREVSHDLTLRRPLDLADGRKVTALDIQWELYDRAKKYELEHGLALGGRGGRRRSDGAMGGGARRRSRAT